MRIPPVPSGLFVFLIVVDLCTLYVTGAGIPMWLWIGITFSAIFKVSILWARWS